MIAVAVMAFGKERNRINVADFKRLLKLPLVKLAADSWNQAASMKVEVNLPIT